MQRWPEHRVVLGHTPDLRLDRGRPFRLCLFLDGLRKVACFPLSRHRATRVLDAMLILFMLFQVVQPTKGLDAARYITRQPHAPMCVFVFAKVPFEVFPDASGLPLALIADEVFDG